MTESARLPRFVREALEGEAGSTADAAAHDATAALDFERSLLSLERALGAASPVPNGDAGAAGLNFTGPNLGGLNLADGDFNRLFERLDGTVSKPPYRYAPFFTRAAELFDLSEDAVKAELARLEDPKVWTFAGLPGIHHATVRGGPRVKSAETLFVRFKPGVYFPRHQHTGLERVLVLEGSYEDSHGVNHVPGELREWPSGTEHSFKVHTGEPCIFASVVFGRRFYAWPLRAMSKLLGK
jgi:quercetin dioxygenase-like cupin family protein